MIGWNPVNLIVGWSGCFLLVILQQFSKKKKKKGMQA